MLSSPDPAALHFKPTPQLGNKGQIRVELPHWAAFVEIHNQDLGRVDDAAIDETEGEMTVCATLAPGVYQVTVVLSGDSGAQWVSVLAGQTVTLPSDLWAGLDISGGSAIKPASGGSKRLAQHIRYASQQPPRTAFGGGEGGLFVFLDSQGRSARSLLRSLTLQPEAGGESLSLRDYLVFLSGRGALAAAHLQLPPGPYLLRASFMPREKEGYAPGARNQLVFVPQHRRTQVLLSGADNLLRSFTYGLADANEEFDPSSEDAVAAAATLQALAHDQAEALLSANPKIEALLSREHVNPWLGVLAAYALELGDTPRSDREIRLRTQVREFLLRMLPDHPDVRALYSLSDGSAHSTPPMLRAGLRRVMSAAATRPGICPRGSLLERVAAKLIVDSPWTAWPDFEAGPVVAATEAPTSETALLQAILPTSAPIYPVGPSVLTGQSVGRDVALAAAGFEVHRNMTSHGVPPPAGPALTSKIEKALDGIMPASVSGLTGLTFDAAASGLEAIKAIAGGTAMPIPNTKPDPLGVEALRLSVRHALGETSQQGLKEHNLEDVARELADLAFRLDAAKIPGADQGAARARAMAEKVLGRAHLVVATDEDDRPVLANGAMQALSGSLTSISTDLPWLGSAGSAEGWQRTEVRSAGDQLVGYIHARAGAGTLADESLDGLREALPNLSLKAGLWLYGDEGRRDGYRGEVESLLNLCERLIG